MLLLAVAMGARGAATPTAELRQELEAALPKLAQPSQPSADSSSLSDAIDRLGARRRRMAEEFRQFSSDLANATETENTVVSTMHDKVRLLELTVAEREHELHSTRPRILQLEAELDTSQEELKLERRLNRKLRASLGLLRRDMTPSALSPSQIPQTSPDEQHQ